MATNDPATNFETVPAKPKKTSRPAKVRKHLLTTVYKQEAEAKLDKLHAAGHTVVAILPSGEIRGFEIISYTEE